MVNPVGSASPQFPEEKKKGKFRSKIDKAIDSIKTKFKGSSAKSTSTTSRDLARRVVLSESTGASLPPDIKASSKTDEEEEEKKDVFNPDSPKLNRSRNVSFKEADISLSISSSSSSLLSSYSNHTYDFDSSFSSVNESSLQASAALPTSAAAAAAAPPAPPPLSREQRVDKRFYDYILPALENTYFRKGYFKVRDKSFPYELREKFVVLCQTENGIKKMEALAEKAPYLLSNYPDIFIDLANDPDDLNLSQLTSYIQRVTGLPVRESENHINLLLALPGGTLGILNHLSSQKVNITTTHDVFMSILVFYNEVQKTTQFKKRWGQMHAANDSNESLDLNALTSILSPRDQRFIEALKTKLPDQAIESFLGMPYINWVRLRTLLKVGELLSKPNHGNVHSPKEKGEYGTLQFTLTHDDVIFISFHVIGTGTSKKVNYTIGLNNLNLPLARAKINARRAGGILGQAMTNEAIRELGIINELNALVAKTETPSYIQPSYIFTDLISPVHTLYGLRFNGDGRGLSEAPLKQKVRAFLHIGLGLQQMQQAGYVHHDLKPANTAFIGQPKDESKPIEARIIDFGFTAKLGELRRAGTREYAPPEVGFSRDYFPATFEYDSFAYGALIASVLSYHRVVSLLQEFSNPDNRKNYQSHLEGIYRIFLDRIRSSISQEYVGAPIEEIRRVERIEEIIMGLMAFDPAIRMSVREATVRLRIIDDELWS